MKKEMNVKIFVVLASFLACSQDETRQERSKGEEVDIDQTSSDSSNDQNADATAANTDGNDDNIIVNAPNTENPKPSDVVDTNRYNYSCEEIAKAPDDGFFSSVVYEDKIFLGTFGYSKKPALFSYPHWQQVLPGLTVSESICEMKSFKGYLYAATEQDGYIYRSKDGKSWQKVHDDSGSIACSLGEFKGYLYAQIHSRADTAGGIFYRSSDGIKWEIIRKTTDYSNDEYIKDFFEFNNVFYAFWVNKKTKEGGYLSTTDGKSWNKTNLGKVRLAKGMIWDNEFWASLSPYLDGTYAGVMKFDGKTFKKIYEFKGFESGGNLSNNDGVLFAPVTVKWKGLNGGAALMISRDKAKTFEKVCTFKESEAWTSVVYKGDVYITTKQSGGGGRFYKVIKTLK